MRRDTSFSLRRVAVIAAIAVVTVFAVFPIFWTFLNSFKQLRDIVTPVPKLFFRPTIQNYVRIVGYSDLISALLNSVVIATSSVGIGFVLGAPFAYVLARFQFKAREDLKFWIITLRMMPPVAVIFSFIYIWLRAGLMDTYAAVIFTYLLITIPTVIWLSIEPFRNVPIECEEAAALEGCGPARVFLKIALPVAWPSLIGGVLFAFILVWNEFFIAFTLTSQRMTLPVAVGAFAVIGMQIDWGEVSASMILLSIPPLILAGFFRRFLASYYIVNSKE